MNNTFDSAFSRLSEMLKGDLPPQVNEVLNSLGISKEDIKDTLKKADKDELRKQFNKEELDKALKSLTPEDIEKIKNMQFENDQIEELYKSFLNSKQGN